MIDANVLDTSASTSSKSRVRRGSPALSPLLAAGAKRDPGADELLEGFRDDMLGGAMTRIVVPKLPLGQSAAIGESSPS